MKTYDIRDAMRCNVHLGKYIFSLSAMLSLNSLEATVKEQRLSLIKSCQFGCAVKTFKLPNQNANVKRHHHTSWIHKNSLMNTPISLQDVCMCKCMWYVCLQDLTTITHPCFSHMTHVGSWNLMFPDLDLRKGVGEWQCIVPIYISLCQTGCGIEGYERCKTKNTTVPNLRIRNTQNTSKYHLFISRPIFEYA